jgi:lysophospholipase L1-like esterase
MLSATPLRLAVIGDSLSASYAGELWGAAGDQSWTTQLQTLRSHQITIQNEAFAGATTNSLFHSEAGQAAQVPPVAKLVSQHAVDAVVIIIGSNDILQDVPLLATDPAKFVSTFVTTVVTNVETAILTIAAAGHTKEVLGNVPDATVTPAFQQFVPPAAIPVVQQAIQLADQQIDAFAAAHEIPVADLYSLSHLLNSPLKLGGVTVTNLYAPDFFHPGTVGQGLLANTVLAALHQGYDVNTHKLRLTDQQILDEAHIAHAPGKTYFDVSPFVLFTEEVGEHSESHEHRFAHHQ